MGVFDFGGSRESAGDDSEHVDRLYRGGSIFTYTFFSIRASFFNLGRLVTDVEESRRDEHHGKLAS